MGFVAALTKLNILRLRRRLCLLVAIAAAFVLLARPLAWGVERFLSRGGFTDVTIAVVGEDGSAEAEAVLSFIGSMEDVAAYCSFFVMDRQEAMEALSRGEVTAVLVLPPDFIDGILTGKNRGPALHLDAGRPVESLLILHGAQNAADLLAAAQSGIYAVLNALAARGLLTDGDVAAINLDYLRFTMTRSAMFDQETVYAAGSVSVAAHYAQSLLVWLLLCAGVLFYPVLRGGQGAWAHRLRAAGCTGTLWAAGALLPVLLCCTGLALPACAAGALTAAGLLALALFACGLAGVVCALCPGEELAGAVFFGLSTAIAFFYGGLVPPALLPETVQKSVLYSAARQLLLCARGESILHVLAAGAVLCLVAGVLLRFGFQREART